MLNYLIQTPTIDTMSIIRFKLNLFLHNIDTTQTIPYYRITTNSISLFNQSTPSKLPQLSFLISQISLFIKWDLPPCPSFSALTVPN